MSPVMSSNDCGFEEAFKRSKLSDRSDDRLVASSLLAAFSLEGLLQDEEIEVEVIPQGM
jgi:hypothetical protein